MTSWAINGDDVLYSDMGAGAPFVDGDDFTVTTGSITADQNGKTGANSAVNGGGAFNVSAGINALFNSGAAWLCTINEGGRIYGNGTSGNNAVIGGDAGQDAYCIQIYSGGLLLADYTTFQYFSSSYVLDTQKSDCLMKNCTFSHFGTNTFRCYNGCNIYLEDCTWADYESTSCFFISNTPNNLILKNCTMRVTAAGNWNGSTQRLTVYIVGNTTIDKQGVGPEIPDDTNDVVTATQVEDYRYYPELVLSEGNALTACFPTVSHSSIDSGGKLTDSTTRMVYEAFLPFSVTDGSGDVKLYLLKRVFYDGTWYHFSDSGEAEAGDNQKFTIGLSKSGYESNTTTAWADGGTANTTLSLLPPRTQTNAFPSDQTDNLAKFTTGDTVYLGTSAAGGIEADAAVTNVNVQVEIYNMSDVKQGADLLNTTTTLVANVEKTFYAINSDTILSRAGLAVGDYYFKITASGGTPSVGTLVSKCYFAIDALTLPQVQINVFPSDQTDDKGGFLPGDTVYVGLSASGGVTSTVNVANATVQVEIYNLSDVKQGSDLLNASATLVANVEKTFYAINSNVLLQRSGLSAGEYYIKTTVSGGTPTISTEISKCYFNINPSETITNEIHDVSNGYTVEIGAEITVTADYTGDDDLWVEMNDVYFKMTNVSGVCTGIITTSTVRSGGPFTITVHGPSAVSKDCSNPVTITLQSEQTSPFVAIKAIFEDNFVLSGWDTPVVNDDWWEVGRKLIPQAHYDTRHDNYMESEETQLPKNATSGRHLHSIFLIVANPTRAGRWKMECEMRRIFSDPALVQEPYDDVDYIYIHDGGYSCWNSEKDKKTGCSTYFSRWELVVIYSDGANKVV